MLRSRARTTPQAAPGRVGKLSVPCVGHTQNCPLEAPTWDLRDPAGGKGPSPLPAAPTELGPGRLQPCRIPSCPKPAGISGPEPRGEGCGRGSLALPPVPPRPLPPEPRRAQVPRTGPRPDRDGTPEPVRVPGGVSPGDAQRGLRVALVCLAGRTAGAQGRRGPAALAEPHFGPSTVGSRRGRRRRDTQVATGPSLLFSSEFL